MSPMPTRESQRAYQRRHRAELRREWLLANGPCRWCGSWDDLEVDHLNPYEKDSHTVWTWSESRRAHELAKCQVLCGSCHRAKTAIENRKAIVHGTHSGYAYYGCRCDECRRGQAAYMRGDFRPQHRKPRRPANDIRALREAHREYLRGYWQRKATEQDAAKEGAA
jgi:hypothetical protein